MNEPSEVCVCVCEIIIPKLRTAFVFIWHDCLHVLLLAAVGEREEGRRRERERRDG